MTKLFSLATIAFVVLGSAAASAAIPPEFFIPSAGFFPGPEPVAVPEPATMALLASGIAGLVAIRHARRQA